MSVQEQVHDLLAPIVATLGLELLDVDFSGSSLRLTVDEPAGGITTERLAEVNRMVSPILDQHDPVPGRYTLEVSSPGLERPLKRTEHFQRAVGEEIVVKLVPEAQPRRIRGALQAVEPGASGGGATLAIDAVEIDGVELDEPEPRVVDVDTIAKARTVFEWGPAPKPGQPGSGKRSGRGGANKHGTKKKKSKTPSHQRGAR
jgi:ribosome maturation factor RimP